MHAYVCMPSREMRIGVIGSGYVGTVTGVGFAELGTEVFFVDFDHERVAALNVRGGIADLRTRSE
jgi:UDP-glucose 6-dehydrogenase